MLVLFESPAGYALFKVVDSGALKDVKSLGKAFADAHSAQKTVELQAFKKFESMSQAVEAAQDLINKKLNKGLKKFLKKEIVKKTPEATLAVCDAELGKKIRSKLKLTCVMDDSTRELMRGIRTQLFELMSGYTAAEDRSMKLGLAHSLCRHKLKFSVDKIDTMIVQAISLLDELDKEINIYAMRIKEWYGWHFPEMVKIVTDNMQYAQTVKKMRQRTNAPVTDLSEFLEEDVEAEVKESAKISMGVDIAEEDMDNVSSLCDQVLELTTYRSQLFTYLQNRMNALAPNLTTMVGELVGARLISHAGSLINLAKHPASTVQILGAEKALFRALKSKTDTPKYGLIYHATLVGQTSPKNKGKISRVLAAKTSLCARIDALSEGKIDNTMGLEFRAKVERRIAQLEGREVKPKREPQTQAKHESKGTKRGYNEIADSTIKAESEPVQKKAKKEKKKKKKKDKKRKIEEISSTDTPAPAAAEPAKKKKKKKKKKDKSAKPSVASQAPLPAAAAEPAKKKKKKKKKKVKAEA